MVNVRRVFKNTSECVWSGTSNFGHCAGVDEYKNAGCLYMFSVCHVVLDHGVDHAENWIRS